MAMNICEMIAFDKVKILDGYPIRIGVLNIPPTLILKDDKSEDQLTKHSGEDAMIINIIWEALNGSVKTAHYKGQNPIGFSEEDKLYTGFMADVTEGRVDHGMNGLWPNIHWRLRSTYPHAASGVHFLTSSKGNMPSWLKFATIYKISVVTGYLASLLIAMIFLRYNDRWRWSAAIMEVLRGTLSMAMLRVPRRLPSRILWSTVFVMFLVMTSSFQGSLISLLTKPTPYRNIDGIDDMIASGYPIYGYAPFKTFFQETKLLKQFHVDDKVSLCLDSVAQGHPIACVSDYMHLRSITMKTERSHMSKQSIGSFYTGYLTKLDWPLFSRFDTLVQRLFNAGITGYWREFYLNKIARENWAEMRSAVPPNRKVLSVADLAFIFHLMIVGLVCSSAIFIIEMAINCYGHRERR